MADAQPPQLTPEELQEKAKEIQRLRYATDAKWREQILEANRKYHARKREEQRAAGAVIKGRGRPPRTPDPARQ
jgi:hypothetical protein